MAYKQKLELSAETTISLGKADAPKSIEGFYLGKKEIPDNFNPGKFTQLHIFQTEAGNVGVWGKTVLNKLLSSELVGQMVLAEFTGLGPKQKGKNPAYLFSVKHDEDNRIDVSGIKAPSAEIVEDDADFEPEAKEVEEAYVAPTKAPKAPAAQPTTDAQRRIAELLAKRK